MLGITRRNFITLVGGAAAWPLAARAQPERIRRVGFLLGNEDEELEQVRIAAFRSELARLGWQEGRNLRIDVRFGGGDASRLRAHAVELVGLAPDVIVTNTAPATRAAQQQTDTIPIIITGAGDTFINGIVKSVTRPEGNTTGITSLFASIGSKWLELLKQISPQLERVGVIYNDRFNSDDPGYGYFPPIEQAAKAFNVEVVKIGYRDAVDLVHAIDQFGTRPNGGLIVSPPSPTAASRETIVRLAIHYRLPTIYHIRESAVEGGLMAYWSNILDRFRRAAYFVNRILLGTKVIELPVEYPTKFDLVVNVTTAKALGLTVPPTLLALANEIIE